MFPNGNFFWELMPEDNKTLDDVFPCHMSSNLSGRAQCVEFILTK